VSSGALDVGGFGLGDLPLVVGAEELPLLAAVLVVLTLAGATIKGLVALLHQDFVQFQVLGGGLDENASGGVVTDAGFREWKGQKTT